MSKKPNYGFDAPNVIRWLFLFAFISVGLAFFAYFMVRGQNLLTAQLIFAYFCLTALSFLIPAIWMVYGTQSGKQKILSETLQKLPFRGDEKTLDAGCGRGMFLIEAAKRTPRGQTVGIDLWEEHSVKSALLNAELEGVGQRIELQTADIRSIPYPDDTFDWVLSSLAIHNIEEEKEREQALKEIYRVLKPGGHFVLLDFRNTAQYASYLKTLGAKEVTVSKPNYHYFPPIRIVKGKKV